MVGVERDSSVRGAGARTHAPVSLGAALFTVAGAYGFGDIERTANVDPARITAQVATGVGFIGAGAIIRNGTSVHGVTTAATVWLAASVGVVCAAGGYTAALVQNIVVEDDENDTTSDGVRDVTMQVSVRRPADLDEIVEHLGHRPEIRAVRVGAGETD